MCGLGCAAVRKSCEGVLFGLRVRVEFLCGCVVLVVRLRANRVRMCGSGSGSVGSSCAVWIAPPCGIHVGVCGFRCAYVWGLCVGVWFRLCVCAEFLCDSAGRVSRVRISCKVVLCGLSVCVGELIGCVVSVVCACK